MNHMFPSWEVMLSIDAIAIAIAVAATSVVFMTWSHLRAARALNGTALLLLGLWASTTIYVLDLFTMAVMPLYKPMEEAMKAMSFVHLRLSWYINAVAAALTFVGLGIVVLRLVQHLKLAESAQAEAEQQSRHKSEFLASMSHEFRTPLNAVVGYAQMLQLHGLRQDPERVKEYAQHIETSGRLLNDLVNDLLDLSRIEAGAHNLSFDRMALDAVVGDVVAMFEGVAQQSDVEIVTDFGGALAPILADRRAVEQIALNLLSNAVNHMPDGGRVVVSVTAPSAEGLCLTVSDTGPGIPPERLPHVFEPFNSGDPMKATPSRSHGLGLSICKKLIEAHGGGIAIDSTLGKGTRVMAVFPLAPQSEEDGTDARLPAGFGAEQKPAQL